MVDPISTEQSQAMVHPRGLPASLLELNRTLVMGVLNVTPDSFSDGGRFFDSDTAIAQGRSLSLSGSDIVDVGGESARPGASRISVQEEIDRVIPVISALTAEGIPVSVDTMRANVAKLAVDSGACMVNDISGGRSEPEMLELMADLQVPYVMMHWRGPSDVMQQMTDYNDVAFDVASELSIQVNAAIKAGVSRDHIVIDPGIGFAKTPEQNWPVLQHLAHLDDLELPVLWGVSRKRFLGELLADGSGNLRDTDERDDATAALTTYLALAGMWGVRVHAPRASRDAIEVVERLMRDDS